MNDKDFQITIENDIPVPTHGKRKHTGLTAKLREMQVGQSIEIPVSSRANVFSVAKAANIKITTRIEEDGQTIRVWRVENEDGSSGGNE